MIQDILDRLNLCGCGDPDVPLRVIHDALESMERTGDTDEDWKLKWSKCDKWLKPQGNADPIRLFVLYVLDSWDLTEHGSSIFSAWLTPEGEELLMALRQSKCSRELLEQIVQNIPHDPS